MKHRSTVQFCTPSLGATQEDFETLKYLLRACLQELSSFQNYYHGVHEEYVVNSGAISTEKNNSKMAVENNVYLAKLAEQAERYEGEVISPP